MTEILQHEYSEEFDRLRKNRVEVAFYKYGAARDNFGSGRVDALATAELYLEAFKKDHNTEHLLDAANYLMFRYMYPLPGESFTATDSDPSVHKTRIVFPSLISDKILYILFLLCNIAADCTYLRYGSKTRYWGIEYIGR